MPRRPAHIPRIALTGGIASGKSTAARLFQTLGAQLIDTDQIARDIVTPPSPVLDHIAQRFGANILNPDGTLNRARLRAVVFADPAARADLEALTHPEIRAEVARRSARQGGPYQLIAVPLLAEKQTQHDYDRVLVVDTTPALQLQRLQLRDGVDTATAQRMLNAQASREQRLAIADDVIDNDGDIARLAPQVEALHRRYLELESGALESG
jgi:dephospho-CoA kinase